MGRPVLARLGTVVRRQHDEERLGGRVDRAVDQRHAHRVGHHAGEHAVGGERRHRPDAAGQPILAHRARHHRHVLFGNAEADAAAQRIVRPDQAPDLLGLAGQHRLHQVAGADVEERRLLHRPGEPRLGGAPGGNQAAFLEHQFRRQFGRAAERAVVLQRPARQRRLHALFERRLGGDLRRRDRQPIRQVVAVRPAQAVHHHARDRPPPRP